MERVITGYCTFKSTYDAVVNKFPSGSHFVEVGGWMGFSSIYMAKKIKESKKEIKFDVVDIWEIYPNMDSELKKEADVIIQEGGTLYQHFLENIELCKVDDIINPKKGYSHEIALSYPPKSLDFIFIDAGHYFEEVLSDLNSWFPLLKEGGIIAGDDFNWEEVKNAVTVFFTTSNFIGKRVYAIGNTWIYCNYKLYDSEIVKRFI